MTQEEKSKKLLKAEEAVRQATANLRKVEKEEREKKRKEMNCYKYMMGGVIAKYFPDCYGFSEQEMNRIIACAFKNRDVLNMISVVVRERPDEKKENNLGNPNNTSEIQNYNDVADEEAARNKGNNEHNNG